MKTTYAIPTTLMMFYSSGSVTTAFTMNANILRNHVVSSSTMLHLEDEIAEMIDMELLRLTDKQEYFKQMKEQHKKTMQPVLPTQDDYTAYAALNSDDIVEQRRDKRMARNNPAKYCADRCISTGHCEVYEDYFDMGPDEVIKFCNECVLSDDELPCDIPDSMLDGDYPELALRP
mmetsp:Transcript_629/g.976  ORF Transcript_629/g.976 Transcript_629/m.976 type:complete len:175 (+) Transcript_629:135-659(+)